MILGEYVASSLWRRGCAPIGLAVALLAFPAAAEPATEPQSVTSDTNGAAQAAKLRADALYDARRYRDAISAYAEAGKNPAILYNVGRSYQFLDEWPQALEHFERFAREAPKALLDRVPNLGALIAEARLHVARIEVSSNVAKARIVMNKVEVGLTPVSAPIAVNAGRAHLEVIADGFGSFERDYLLEGGRTISVEAFLVEKERAAKISIKTDVPAVDIFIDQKRQGQTPGALTLSAGPHVLRLEKDGYSAKDFDLVLAPREVRDLSVSLDKPPITSKWWFWTAIGGVVAAGAVTTFVLLTTERSPDGSPSLGSFRAP